MLNMSRRCATSVSILATVIARLESSSDTAYRLQPREGLWETTRTKGRVRTLYAITDCKRLNRPFPIARLVKISDGAPLSSGYRYSYSVVRPVGAPSSDASVQRTASRDARRGR